MLGIVKQHKTSQLIEILFAGITSGHCDRDQENKNDIFC